MSEDSQDTCTAIQTFSLADCGQGEGRKPRTVRLVQEGRLLEGTTDDRLGIKLQPLVQDRRIDATEIHVWVQIALHQVFRLKGGVFAKVAAVNLLSQDKDRPSSTVI